MKTCIQCKEEKDESEFTKDCQKPDGLRSYCRPCLKTRTRTQKGYAEILEDSPETVMLWRAKNRAKSQGVPFDITEEDIKIPDYCPVYAIPLSRSNGKPSDGSPSLDKVIPELGYVKGNVRVISNLANRRKSDSSEEDLKLLLKYIEEHKYV